MAENSILIVEDETHILEATSSYLTLEGFAVHEARTLEQAFLTLEQHTVDIIILDLGLGQEDGLDLITSGIVSKSTKIIITSARNEIQDRVKGFNLGVDTYLVKPISLEELGSIIHNFIRKTKLDAPFVKETKWKLDKKSWILTAPNHKDAKLTLSEMKLLLKLGEKIGVPVTRKQIILALDADIATYDLRRLEVLVRRLRKKTQDKTALKIPISTARNVGYAFTEELIIQ